MTMSYPVASMVASIKNALLARRVSCAAPYSGFKEAVLRVLQKEGFVDRFVVQLDEQGRKSLEIFLRYYQGAPALKKLDVISAPGRRVYRSCDALRTPYFNGLGVRILSTSQGVMTDKDARARRLGGELLCNCF